MEQVLSELEAKSINDNPFLSQLKAELIPEKTKEKEYRETLIEKAKSLGINFPKNISDEKLEQKIKETENEQQ